MLLNPSSIVHVAQVSTLRGEEAVPVVNDERVSSLRARVAERFCALGDLCTAKGDTADLKDDMTVFIGAAGIGENITAVRLDLVSTAIKKFQASLDFLKDRAGLLGLPFSVGGVALLGDTTCDVIQDTERYLGLRVPTHAIDCKVARLINDDPLVFDANGTGTEVNVDDSLIDAFEFEYNMLRIPRRRIPRPVISNYCLGPAFRNAVYTMRLLLTSVAVFSCAVFVHFATCKSKPFCANAEFPTALFVTVGGVCLWCYKWERDSLKFAIAPHLQEVRKLMVFTGPVSYDKWVNAEFIMSMMAIVSAHAISFFLATTLFAFFKCTENADTAATVFESVMKQSMLGSLAIIFVLSPIETIIEILLVFLLCATTTVYLSFLFLRLVSAFFSHDTGCFGDAEMALWIGVGAAMALILKEYHIAEMWCRLLSMCAYMLFSVVGWQWVGGVTMVANEHSVFVPIIAVFGLTFVLPSTFLLYPATQNSQSMEEVALRGSCKMATQAPLGNILRREASNACNIDSHDSLKVKETLVQKLEADKQLEEEYRKTLEKENLILKNENLCLEIHEIVRQIEHHTKVLLQYTDQTRSSISTSEDPLNASSKVGKVVVPPEQRTTVMMRNIPNNYTKEMLFNLLDNRGFKQKYDLGYMPIDFKKQVGLGYAFINFVDCDAAALFFEVFNGFSAWVAQSDKKCEVAWSDALQGRDANINRYRNSPIMHPSVPDLYKPVLFDRNGMPETFPRPTKRIRPPREWRESN